MLMIMKMIIMKIIIMTIIFNVNDYDLWFNISRNIQGQGHVMEHLETSDTLPVCQTLEFLLDWTN